MGKLEKLLLVAASAALAFFIITSAAHENKNPYSRKAVIMNGNHAFIALKMDGTPEKNAASILKVIEEFEKDFNVQVTYYFVSSQAQTNEKDALVLGIWTTHCPKTKTPA